MTALAERVQSVGRKISSRERTTIIGYPARAAFLQSDRSNYAALLAAVIDAAVRDTVRHNPRGNMAEQEANRRSARRFLTSPTFNWYCELLGADPDWVLEMIWDVERVLAIVDGQAQESA